MVCQVSQPFQLLTASHICRLTSFTNWRNIHSLFLIFLFLRWRIPKPRTVCMLGKHYSAIISQGGEKSSPPLPLFLLGAQMQTREKVFVPWVSGAVAPVCIGSLALSWLSLASTKGSWVIWMSVWRTRAHCLWLSGCLALLLANGLFLSFYDMPWIFLLVHSDFFFFFNLPIATHTNHLSSQEAEAGRLWVQAHSLLHERTLSQTKTKEKTF